LLVTRPLPTFLLLPIHLSAGMNTSQCTSYIDSCPEIKLIPTAVAVVLEVMCVASRGLMFPFSRISKSCFSRNVLRTSSKSYQCSKSRIPSEVVDAVIDEKYAVIRVDTHGNRFIVQQFMSQLEAKRMEADFDLLTHHQGYYVVNQKDVEMELKR
jgi:hypothetical protein